MANTSLVKKLVLLLCVTALILCTLTSCNGEDLPADTFGNTPSGTTSEDDHFNNEFNSSSDRPIKPTSSYPSHISFPSFNSIQGFSKNNGNSVRGYNYMPSVTEIMPAINIETADGKDTFVTDYGRDEKILDLIDYVGAKISVTGCEDKYRMNGIEAEVKVRGNYTLDYDKKPIRIKFTKKQGMLGLNGGNKFKSWVLLADYKDLSLSHNSVAYYLGNVLLGSDGLYCTDFRTVEVYINGRYWGVYILAEQQEVKEGRTSVPEVPKDYKEKDIGYFFEYDNYYVDEQNMPNGAGDPTFTIDYGTGRYFQKGYTVKSDINDKKQLNFLKSYVQNAFRIIREATMGNFYKFNNNNNGLIAAPEITNPKQAIEKVLNIDSVVDMYILSEICRDPDIAMSSFYLSLDMTQSGTKKINLEAPWDFDSGLGIKNDDAANTHGLYAAETANPWLHVLTSQDWFWDMVKAKWAKLKQHGILDNTLNLVLKQKTVYEKYYARNYQRWSDRIGWGLGILRDEHATYKNQAQAADYLHSWLKERFNYLDSQWE